MKEKKPTYKTKPKNISKRYYFVFIAVMEPTPLLQKHSYKASYEY